LGWKTVERSRVRLNGGNVLAGTCIEFFRGGGLNKVDDQYYRARHSANCNEGKWPAESFLRMKILRMRMSHGFVFRL
jgi:hypothetical protein